MVIQMASSELSSKLRASKSQDKPIQIREKRRKMKDSYQAHSSYNQIDNYNLKRLDINGICLFLLGWQRRRRGDLID